jgi:hypothetical protein
VSGCCLPIPLAFLRGTCGSSAIRDQALTANGPRSADSRQDRRAPPATSHGWRDEQSRRDRHPARRHRHRDTILRARARTGEVSQRSGRAWRGARGVLTAGLSGLNRHRAPGSNSAFGALAFRWACERRRSRTRDARCGRSASVVSDRLLAIAMRRISPIAASQRQRIEAFLPSDPGLDCDEDCQPRSEPRTSRGSRPPLHDQPSPAWECWAL